MIAGPVLSSSQINRRIGPVSVSYQWISHFKFSVRGLFSYPHASSIKNLYDNRLMSEIELAVHVFGPAALWLSGDFYSGNGNLPLTGEPTSIRLIGAAGGLMFRSRRGIVHPYAGGGAYWSFFRESNAIGRAEGEKFGWMARAGLDFSVSRNLAVDVSAAYTECYAQPQNIRINLGSIRAGLGLSLTF